MSFKKLQPAIKRVLQSMHIEEPTPFQKSAIGKIKGGGDYFLIGDKGIGKTMTLIISVMQKLDAQPKGSVPRALIFVEDKQAVIDLEEQFAPFVKETEIRVLPIYDEHNILWQREDIFGGTDIIITTPKRFSKIYFGSGVALSEVKIMAVEDAEFLSGKDFHTDIDRISESLNKCQYLVIGKTFTNKMGELTDELWMEKAQTMEG